MWLKRKHTRIHNICVWFHILYVCECICSTMSDKPPRCGTGCCLTNGSPLTSSLGVSSEIHHVTSWSTCSADILPEMPFRFDSSGLDTIVCLLHNLSAGKLWSNFFSFFFFPLLLSTRRSYLRLSVSQNQCIHCSFHCELRGRDSDCDGFACFFLTGPCANGG